MCFVSIVAIETRVSLQRHTAKILPVIAEFKAVQQQSTNTKLG
jgi:hypothetical protein